MAKGPHRERAVCGARTVLLLFAGGLLASCTTAPAPWYQPPARQPKPGQVRFSYVVVADVRAVDQFGPGWYEIENGTWRWMGREAIVYVKKPPGSDIVFTAKLFVPETVIQRVGAPSLKVLLNGEGLTAQRFPRAGAYVIEQPVPHELLRGDVVRVELKLDRAMPPSGADQRELGVVVTAVGLREKPKG